jgi:hypothetical protein
VRNWHYFIGQIWNKHPQNGHFNLLADVWHLDIAAGVAFHARKEAWRSRG